MFDSPLKAKELAYFDIRLRLGHKNSVFVVGNDLEVESIPINGKVKILTKEDLHVKRIKLKLTGEYSIDYVERLKTGRIVQHVHERNCVLKVTWNNLLVSLEGTVGFGDYGDFIVPSHMLKKSSALSSLVNSPSGSSTSLSSMVRPKNPRTKLVSHLSQLGPQEKSLFRIPQSGIDGTPFPKKDKVDNQSFLLPQGNFSLPFAVVLPANLCQLIEGLKLGKILYKFECQIERGLFEKSFHKAKHIRFVRLLHPQNINFSSSVEYQNTWPGKVEFNVLMPRRALAIGTKVPISLVIVPLAKGISFRSLIVQLVQHHRVKGLGGESQEMEDLLPKQTLDCNTDVTEDCWRVKGHFQMPSLLQEVSPTCNLKNDLVVVRHRLCVALRIRNADGHVSELKANLPVCVHISTRHGVVTTRHLEVDAKGHFTAEADPGRVDIVCSEPEEEKEEEGAPPEYGHHVNDCVFDQNSPKTPIEQLRTGGIKQQLDSYFLIPVGSPSVKSPPLDVQVLLRVPSYERAVEDESEDRVEEPAPFYDWQLLKALQDNGRSKSFGSLQIKPKRKLKLR